MMARRVLMCAGSLSLCDSHSRTAQRCSHHEARNRLGSAIIADPERHPHGRAIRPAEITRTPYNVEGERPCSACGAEDHQTTEGDKKQSERLREELTTSSLTRPGGHQIPYDNRALGIIYTERVSSRIGVSYRSQSVKTVAGGRRRAQNNSEWTSCCDGDRRRKRKIIG